MAYVAKQDGKTVYLDTTQLKTKINPGAVFKFVESSEELKNVQGVSLGKIYKYGPAVSVTSVEEKYSVAALDADYKTKPGQALELQNPALPPAAAQTLPALPPAQNAGEGSVSKIFSSPSFDGTMIAACMSSKDGQNIFILAGEQKIQAADVKGNILAQQQISPFNRILAMSCAPVKNNGRDQIFAVIYSGQNQKINTSVFELQGDKFVQTDALKWAVKAADTPSGKKLFGQEIFKNNGARFSPVGLIGYSVKKGFYYKKTDINAGSNATAFSYNQADLDGDGKTDALFASSYGKLKAALGKGAASEVDDADFASSPVRFNMANEVVRVLPGIPSITQDGKTVFAAAVNTPKAAIVAGSFGMYKSGVVRFYSWDTAGLKEIAKTETGGVIYDLAAVNYNGAPAVMATEVYDSGVTILNIYALKD